MVQSDLHTWLKAAAENKITTKNTWKSNIIEYLADVNQFIENNGLNFQMASSTLDGAVKEFSTRVDDVSENTNKLLEHLDDEIDSDGKDNTKNRQRSKRQNFIEKDVENLNIKLSEQINQTKLFKISCRKTAHRLLLDYIFISSHGIQNLSLDENIFDENVILETKEYPLNLEECDFPICPSIKDIQNHSVKRISTHYTGLENREDLIENKDENVNFENDFQNDFSTEFNNDFNESISETNNPPLITSSNSLNAWAGPEHWKSSISKKTKARKPTQKNLLNFSIKISTNILEKANTIFDASYISRRREDKPLLPNDYKINTEDIYKYAVREGSFYTNNNLEINDTSICGNITTNTEITAVSFIKEDLKEEIVVDIPPTERKDIIENLISKYNRTQKKVDIKKLKDKVYFNVEKNKIARLSDIYSEIKDSYDEIEKKDISVHYCIISLLHLASENSIDIQSGDNDILVKYL
ncbi:subunit 2 of condensin complex [Hamiltosporidium magnivora]|uniref:Condensin complex subunit 2 n=1 Tax=Hamiltosporidium magnivora TaxID=148818 RepID=A0A4Q9LBE4_9MICR|nr:subunit 2 of condensin complex [Hamiltosporidium magnivora]